MLYLNAYLFSCRSVTSYILRFLIEYEVLPFVLQSFPQLLFAPISRLHLLVHCNVGPPQTSNYISGTPRIQVDLVVCLPCAGVPQQRKRIGKSCIADFTITSLNDSLR